MLADSLRIQSILMEMSRLQESEAAGSVPVQSGNREVDANALS